MKERAKSKMEIVHIKMDAIALAVTPIGDRYSRLFHDTCIDVVTKDEGVFKFKFKSGFITNFRSGGVFVDFFIDQIGDEKKSLWYLIHDAIYTPCAALGMEHPMSRKKGDELLRAGLIHDGMSKFYASVVYKSVRIFGHTAYWKDDKYTQSNSKLLGFEWCDKTHTPPNLSGAVNDCSAG